MRGHMPWGDCPNGGLGLAPRRPPAQTAGGGELGPALSGPRERIRRRDQPSRGAGPSPRGAAVDLHTWERADNGGGCVVFAGPQSPPG